MSDVHSVGGYVFAGSLFALGLTSWQVLISLLDRHRDRERRSATWWPSPASRPGCRIRWCAARRSACWARISRSIRGLIAVAWYGIQTFLARARCDRRAQVLAATDAYADVHRYGFLGLSALGWAGFMMLWVLQAAVFWRGMEMIRKFIDFAGPAVYVVMFILAGSVWHAG